MIKTKFKPRKKDQTIKPFLSEEQARFNARSDQRKKLLPKAVALGVLSGLLAVAFRYSLDFGEQTRGEWLRLAHQHETMGLAAVLLLSALATMLAGWIVARFAPEASGSGIPHLKAVLQGQRQFNWLRVIIVKFISGLVAISTGLALGREGPTVQMGGAVGHALARNKTGDDGEARILVAAGGGAGLAAAFNAPLSGLMFVLEELQENCATVVFFVAALACLASDMICRQLLGQLPIFPLAINNAPSLYLLPVILPLGAVCGIVGVIFNKALLAGQRLVVLPMFGRWVYWGFWGVIVGLIGWWRPEMLGGGQHLAKHIVAGQTIPQTTIIIFFVVRFFLTIGSYSTGVAGGIFAPVLVLGALLGLGMGEWAMDWFPQIPNDKLSFAVVGMAALFTGVVRAPLTGMVLVIEMTANYELVLPLFLACFVALTVADSLRNLPIYEALLERDLLRHKEDS